MNDLKPPALDPATLPVKKGCDYPEPFKAAVAGRERRALGDALGLKNFGVNLTPTLDRLGAQVVPFAAADVVPAAHIRAASRSAGLSLGDRACLALAGRLGLPALTADRQWRDLQVGVEIRLIRD